MAPKPPPRAPKASPSLDFHRFLVDFGRFVDDFLYHVGLFLFGLPYYLFGYLELSFSNFWPQTSKKQICGGSCLGTVAGLPEAIEIDFDGFQLILVDWVQTSHPPSNGGGGPISQEIGTPTIQLKPFYNLFTGGLFNSRALEPSKRKQPVGTGSQYVFATRLHTSPDFPSLPFRLGSLHV